MKNTYSGVPGGLPAGSLRPWLIAPTRATDTPGGILRLQMACPSSTNSCKLAGDDTELTTYSSPQA